MLDNVYCTVVKPWDLLLRMRQRCIGWSIVWYIFTMYISYITIYGIYSRHKVSLTWDLKPIPLDLCSDTCSTELASLTQERPIQSMFTQKVTSKNPKLCLNVGNLAGLTPPKVTLYVFSTSTLAQHYFNFNPLTSSVASLTFPLRLIMNCDHGEYH